MGYGSAEEARDQGPPDSPTQASTAPGDEDSPRSGRPFWASSVAETEPSMTGLDTANGEGEDADVALNEDLDLGPSFLPPFANEENKGLDRAVRLLEKNLEVAKSALEEHRERIGVMGEHLRNVQQEILYTQSRVEARKKEAHTEVHLAHLSEREVGRLQVEITRLEKEAGELQDKMNALQNGIFRGNEKMDQFRLLMNWNQEEMEQWALASRQKEEDNEVLAKYARMDEGKVKDLGRAVTKLNRRLHELQADLEREITETQAAQIELDKTADDFRTLHDERQELVRQWEEAEEAMRRRDDAIREAAERFAENRQRLRGRQAQLDARAKLLETEQGNNRELDNKIFLCERNLTKLKETLDTENNSTKGLQEEVELLKRSLTSAASELAMQKATNQQGHSDLETKRHKVEAMQRKVEAVRRRLRTEFAALDSLEARTGELRRLHAAEEERWAATVKELQELKERQFKTTEELHQLRLQEKNVASEIAGAQAQARNLVDKLKASDAEMVKQQEVLYSAEFQIQALERKVARAQGERSDQERRELTLKINALQAHLEEKTQQHALLTAQVKKSEEDLQVAKRRGDECQKEAAILNAKISELALESDTAIRVVKTIVKEKEDKMVAHDILKLEVSRLHDILNLRADEVYSLENRKYQLQMAMEERRNEIEVVLDTLRAQLRAAQEDIHRANLERKERGLRVAKLQAKYEVLVGKMRKEDGEEHSQAYYIIKAAQEREALQREGDEWDEKIRQADREVRALEVTLQKLNEKNGQFRSSFRPAEGGEAAEENERLRERLDRTFDKMKFKRTEEQTLTQDVEIFESRLANIQREEAQVAASVDELQRRLSFADKELGDQVDKAKRAAKRLEKLRRDLSTRSGAAAAATLEKEIALVDAREANRVALVELRNLAADNPGARALIEGAVTGAGLRLPAGTASAPSSRASSRAGSQAGSRSSMASSQSRSSSTGGLLRKISASNAGPSSSRGPSITNVELGMPR